MAAAFKSISESEAKASLGTAAHKSFCRWLERCLPRGHLCERLEVEGCGQAGDEPGGTLPWPFPLLQMLCPRSSQDWLSAL